MSSSNDFSNMSTAQMQALITNLAATMAAKVEQEECEKHEQEEQVRLVEEATCLAVEEEACKRAEEEEWQQLAEEAARWVVEEEKHKVAKRAEQVEKEKENAATAARVMVIRAEQEERVTRVSFPHVRFCAALKTSSSRGQQWKLRSLLGWCCQGQCWRREVWLSLVP